MAIENESIQNLFADLGISAEHTSKSLETLAAVNHKYIRDLKLNVGAVLGSQNMTRKEALLLALSIAVNEKNDVLISAFEGLAAKEGATADEIAETHGCASLLSVNNVFYRFKHFMAGVEFYQKTPAGLRMSIMMNPAMGKPLFELMSLAVSAVNGCEQCVTSHEYSVREQGADQARVYDAIRLAAVIKGLCTVI
jgi:lipoyl-dependent peroxiredoxin subunit D